MGSLEMSKEHDRCIIARGRAGKGERSQAGLAEAELPGGWG